MKFTELLDEWLTLREVEQSTEEDMRPFSKRREDSNRQEELAATINSIVSEVGGSYE